MGVVPWFARCLYPVVLVKSDPATGALLREATSPDSSSSALGCCARRRGTAPSAGPAAPSGVPGGRCVRCAPGEVGQVLGLINDDDPSRRFDGYTDAAATAKKVRVFTGRPCLQAFVREWGMGLVGLWR